METRQINLNSKYQPLFRAATRYVIVVGGRGSGKSFAITTALCHKAMTMQGKTILFTRYTLTNAKASIIPEFVDKITLLGWENYFYVHPSANEIICVATGTKILFRGLKTSSGINTAALKSIPNLALWVNDESEELVDGNLFDTIDLSIRANDVNCQVWLVLNPTDIQHFIYRKFFKDNGVGDVTNGVRDNVTYIHTTYLDNVRNLPSEYIALAEKSKGIDESFYNNIWLGHWAKLGEGLIFRDWQQITDADYPTTLPCWYGVDWGFSNDPAAVVRVCFNPITYTLYIKELLYEKGHLTGDIATIIHKDIATRKRDYILKSGAKVSWDGVGFSGAMDDSEECRRIRRAIENREGEIYCDPARPEQIREMKINHYLNAMGANNADKVGRIEYLKYFNVCYIGDNIHNEVTSYRWQTSKTDKTQYVNIPQDGNDHCFIGSTLITTINGLVPIKDIQEGDMVLTSQGWKKVLIKWDNGVKEVLHKTLKFSNFSIDITATPTHKFKTRKGWKYFSQIKEGDKLYLLSNLMVESTKSMKGQNISLATNGNFIERCGSSIMGIFRKGIKSIIKTLTQITIILKTSFVCLLQSIINYTKRGIENMGLLKKESNTLIPSDRLHQAGIKVRKGENGIDNITLNQEKNKNILVSCVEQYLNQRRKMQNTAQTSVMQSIGEIQEKTMKQDFVKSADNLLKPIDLARLDFVECLVLRGIEDHCTSRERVYDLTVEDNHEYFANGILVHNCMDSINYAATTHLRRLGIANKLGER